MGSAHNSFVTFRQQPRAAAVTIMAAADIHQEKQKGQLMKHAISASCLFVLVIGSLSAQHAPWQKTAGPPGLKVNVIYKAGGVVYAGTDTQGVYRSTDNGVTWIVATNGIERTSINDMIASGGNLLAAVRNSCLSLVNVFKSTDNGNTWSPTTGLEQ